ncbi:hypothetical protein [Phreatobacter stygius]|uniref:DUF4431 domain-containing protein n=1 Tax=Phreatobacter stygius TaxID=1940610 RepID=A0A4D7BL72_9HYPH|nr:hypothetical protein [Phreatobacter stygius]QCI68482.1 hypothetical protein E8M01_32200 [Phreatobacter stygius]
MTLKVAIGAALLGSLLLSGAGFAQTPGQTSCTNVGGNATSRFTGRLSHHVFPGPPGYQDVRRGDAREPAYILTLRQQTCVNAEGDEALQRVRLDRIHLRLDNRNPRSRTAYRGLRRFIGQDVSVTGTDGFGEHTGHHRAPLVLTVVGVAARPGPDR